MRIIVTVPTTGIVDSVIERKEGSLKGTLVTLGENEPVSIGHLQALIGEKQRGIVRTEIVDENPEDSVAQMIITSDDERWIKSLRSKLASLDNDPEKLRAELQKMEVEETTDDVELEPGVKTQAVRRSIKYKSRGRSKESRFPKVSISTEAQSILKDIRSNNANNPEVLA